MRIPHLFRLLIPGKLVTVIQLLLVVVVMSGETRCPTYWDRRWKQRDGKCDGGKKYHCFEDERGNVVSDGCYEEKQCLKGAHPAVEGNHIRCIYCKSGYQPEEPLYSSKFTFSYCTHHSRPCRPEYGKSMCQQGTRESDVRCTCNASLGFFPKFEGENCTCFTPNDPCSGCSFKYCPNGSRKNDRGFCEPIRSVIFPSSLTTYLVTSPSVSTREPADNDTKVRDITLGVVLPLLAALVIALIILCRNGKLKKCWNKDQHKDHSERDTTAEQKLIVVENGSSSPSAEVGKDKTAEGRSGDTEKPSIVQNGTFYYRVKHMTVGNPSTMKIGRTGNLAIDLVESRHGSPETASSAQPSDACENKGDLNYVPADPEQSTTDPVDSSAPLLPMADSSAPLLPMAVPSAPLPSLAVPSAPLPSLAVPSAPLPSLAVPSAPLPSLAVPSAPLPSLAVPSAPLPSIPVMDNSQPDQEERQLPDDGNDGETNQKVGETEEEGKKVASAAEKQQPDDDETLRKVPFSFQSGETEEEGKKVTSLADDNEETLRKVPFSFQSGETEEEGKKVASPGKPWQPIDNGETLLKVPVSVKSDIVKIKTPLLSDSAIDHHVEILPGITEPEKVALHGVMCTPITDDEETDFRLNVKT